MKKLKIIWTETAKFQLKWIYNDYMLKSETVAKNIKNDILNAPKRLVFAKQFQKDNIEPEFRRIIVRHYKLIYHIEGNKIYILRIFNARKDPEKQTDIF